MDLSKAIASISAFASLALASPVDCNQDYEMVLNAYKDCASLVTKSNATSKELQQYNAICDNVNYMLEMATFQICKIQSFNDNERVILENFLSIVSLCKGIALERVKMYQLESDKKVLYSVAAVEHILEAVLDDEFFKLTGGYKMPSDFMAFGKDCVDLS